SLPAIDRADRQLTWRTTVIARLVFFVHGATSVAVSVWRATSLMSVAQWVLASLRITRNGRKRTDLRLQSPLNLSSALVKIGMIMMQLSRSGLLESPMPGQPP